jgi:hypothetical protein
MAKATKRKFSMRAEAGEEGLFGNVRAKIAKAFYGTYGEHAPQALNEKRVNGTPDDPVAVIEFEQDGVEENVTQYFGCGSAARLVPSEDGEEPASEGPFLCPAEGSTAHGLNKQTGMYRFIQSLGKPVSGKLKFNDAVLDEKGLDGLVGLDLFVARVPSARASSVAVEEGAREQTQLVCGEIFELPKGSKGKKVEKDEDEDETPKKKGKKVEKEEEGDDLVSEAQAIVVSALEKAGEKGIKKDLLPKKCFAAISKSSDRKAILELIQDDDFISNDEAPWNYDEDEETLTQVGD